MSKIRIDIFLQVPFSISVYTVGKYGVGSPKFIWAPVYSCTHWLRPRNFLLLPLHLGSYTRALLVSQDRRHLFGIHECYLNRAVSFLFGPGWFHNVSQLVGKAASRIWQLRRALHDDKWLMNNTNTKKQPCCMLLSLKKCTIFWFHFWNHIRIFCKEKFYCWNYINF